MPRAGIVERAEHSGVDLNASTLEWGRREQAPASVRLTDRDLMLMALLHDVNFLSASQLLVLGWGESGAAVGLRRLKRLHDSGYLDRFRPVVWIGSAQWNYRLSSQGWRALRARESTRCTTTYTPTAITSPSYTEHDLQVASLILHIARRVTGARRGGLIDSLPFTWRGPRSGRIDMNDAARMNTSPAATLPRGTRLHPQGSRRGYLEPDATLIAQAGDARWAVLIEYDRTDRPHKQVDRLRRYDRWLLDGWREGEFVAHAVHPMALFVTARERPLRRLIETADRTFSAWYGHQHAGPRQGTFPARQRVVFTSRERILAGEWTMQRVPSLPPPLREDPGTCIPSSVVYDLPALFAAEAINRRPQRIR
jgi:hypothetical protein